MEAKKTPKADLTKKSSFFFSIGLLITMSIVVMAFEWRDTEKQEIDLVGKSTNTFEEMLEIPPTEQPPPPPPQVQQPQIVEVPDEEEIEEEIQVKFDVEVTEETKVQQIVIQAEEPKEEVEEIFTIVEDPASPVGGMTAFYQYVGDKIKYPPQARRMGVEGRVFVEFVIDKDGSITDVKAVKGIGAGCDEEAVRILQSAPKWKPGKQRGKPVKQRMVLPITFKLG
ncbi:MAG TPA: TonB family protein [Cyclobacteriaceae bacterium]|nr:TonB family protein [Cyclobacteriaceae bacterium]MCB9237513.1 TonB family protein [Flammeovirgaceae bacterium]MCB0500316.1 TonB family protein [Cyclobacteriaceae bacterium]MCO5270384.1 TonB family protein [Cyclobacteriaceae bacterium]MCW5903555.1 TonB family protein [Cyclobacteriaceae bacterium]